MRKPKVKTAPTPPAEANPETIREPNPEAAGLGVLIQHTYAKRPVSDYIDLVAGAGARILTEMDKRQEAQSVAIEQHEALRNRNRTGALGKAKNNLTDKQNVRQVYDDLTAQHSKKPTCDLLHNKLIEKYGERKWSGHTIRKGITKLNKGEDI